LVNALGCGAGFVPQMAKFDNQYTAQKILLVGAEFERERRSTLLVTAGIDKLFWVCIACIAIGQGALGWVVFTIMRVQ
jgi:hypothetical protein